MGLFVFQDAYTAVFDNGQLTTKGQELTHTEWVDLATVLTNNMPASDEHMKALHHVFAQIDWASVEVKQALTIFHKLGTIDVVGFYSPYVQSRADLLDVVFDQTFHRSSSEEVETVLANHLQWQPSVLLARDFMAHLVYNNIPSDHDYRAVFGLFLKRCSPETIVGVFEEYGWDFLDPDDNNWEISFVTEDIDQYSAQWPIETQTRLHNAVSSREYFPTMAARVQRHVLNAEVQHHSKTSKNSARRI